MGPGADTKRSRYNRNEDLPTHTFTPHTYQVELLDAALARNTIVCLGTGTGKTFIAIMMIKELAHQIRPPFNQGGKRSIFLVNTVQLVYQQAQAAQQHTDLSVGRYVGEMNVDRWSASQWQKELQMHNVLVMTAQIFLDLLLHDFISISCVNLLIFDECHHASRNHPYAQIMQCLSDADCEKKPRILGLTATIVTGRFTDVTELKRSINLLQSTMQSTAETSTLVFPVKHGTCAKEIVCQCEEREDPFGLTEDLSRILEEALCFLYECSIEQPEDNGEKHKDPRQIPKTALSECLNILYELGPWCAASTAGTLVKQLEKLDAHTSQSSHKRLLRYAATQLRILAKMFEGRFKPEYNVEEFLQYVSPKVVKLIQILREYTPQADFMIIEDDSYLSDGSDMSDDSMCLSDPDIDEGKSRERSPEKGHVAVKRCTTNPDNKPGGQAFSWETEEKYLCCIVFVERRFVAYALNKLIEELCAWDDCLCFIKSSSITGHGLKSAGVKKDLEQGFRKQELILRRFRMQELNLLVSTCVLEEGVDVPRCNLVIRFDLPKDYRSYTQSKGRARARNAEYVMLVDADKLEKFKEDLKMYRGIENVLLGHFCDRVSSEEPDYDPAQVNALVPPYVPQKDAEFPRVTMSSAIALVNRYCAKLPSDAFTHLTPRCTVVQVGDGDPPCFVAKLRLPINSPIKDEIEGYPMPRKKLAKMAVALKMCELLHKEGELDDNLMPVGKEVLWSDEEESEWDSEEGSGQARPGTTKHKQHYFKKAASALLGSEPQPNSQCCLYVFSMRLTGPITDDQNTRGRDIFAPETVSQCLGMLTANKLPMVPNFPVYTRSGELTVSVDLMQCNVVLGAAQLWKLKLFHKFIFSNVLKLEKDPMDYAPELAPVSYFIVPLNEGMDALMDIDWPFVEKVEHSLSDPNQASYGAKQETFVFNKDLFDDAVVMPLYRNVDQRQHFYVAEIRTDLTPFSSFPSPELYVTFSDYYQKKYGISVVNNSQPLLDVDHTSARLNLLTPRYMNQKGVALSTSSAETKRACREDLQQKQILIPELCEVHVFSSSMWRKAVCIPTILYRINYLLIAEEMRIIIARETCIGIVELPADFKFPKLDFGFDTSPEKLKLSCRCKDDNNGFLPDLASLVCNNLTGDKNLENATDVGEVCSDSECERVCLESKTSGIDTVPNGLEVTDENRTSVNNLAEDISAIYCDKVVMGAEPSVFLSAPAGMVSDSSNCDKAAVNSSHSNMQLGNICDEHVPQCIASNKANAMEDKISEVNSSKGIQDQACIHSHNRSDSGRASADGVSADDTWNRVGISLDANIELSSYIGPSPCTILQALTMSNANDFFSLERLETIGDSFLKYAITVYLYCSYPGIHEGKLSYLRSKQVSNYNLYRLGKRKSFAESMVSTKFEPYENWLPPGYVINNAKRKGTVPKIIIASSSQCNSNGKPDQETKAGSEKKMFLSSNCQFQQQRFYQELAELNFSQDSESRNSGNHLIPYCLQTQHNIPDKSIADCIEALIGCYLTSCGRRAALLFMSWLGLKVLPGHNIMQAANKVPGPMRFLHISCTLSPLLPRGPRSSELLAHLLDGYEAFEDNIQYHFRDRAYLLQAFTHASYHYNIITDCYQRLEFLGDAVLDYVITRHLFEDSRKYSPGVLTDLRSALVNNNIFAALAVKWDFHKYFKAVSPALFSVIEMFVSQQKEKDDEIDTEDDEGVDDQDDSQNEELELEIPKALGDIFESVAGAIYLDSGMSLDVVWRVYHRMMKPHIERYLKSIPMSPVRELLETEPETAKFEKPERTLDGKIRVTVTVVGKGVFSSVGRNYRIAKSAVAKKALRSIRTMQANGLLS